MVTLFSSHVNTWSILIYRLEYCFKEERVPLSSRAIRLCHTEALYVTVYSWMQSFKAGGHTQLIDTLEDEKDQ